VQDVEPEINHVKSTLTELGSRNMPSLHVVLRVLCRIVACSALTIHIVTGTDHVTAMATASQWHDSSIRVPLTIPRWEAPLLRFMELSGVGMVVEGEDEEERRQMVLCVEADLL
jgi:hypothetical protein